MARCPFAQWDEISGPVGAYAGGPFKIVHHTTEGSSYAGARGAYRANRSDPHFTVAGDTVFQHIDTGMAARALKNPPGGVETNRDSAVQIEVVGFAGRPKDVATLQTVARLCRWIEGEHAIPQAWPNGLPRSSSNGGNPGGHNRDAAAWDAEGGHYGHSQVPENDHWDPGYTPAEVALVTPDAVFDPHADLGLHAEPAVVNELAAPVTDVDAEAIVGRVIEQVRASLPSPGEGDRLQVRVSAGGVEIEVTIFMAGRASRRAPVRRGSAAREKARRSKR